MRIAIVTAYYKEAREVLERNLRSVVAQTVAADHILVADGHPQDWLDGAGVRHLRLDRSHGDWGNTPRAVGGMLAAAEAYDGFCFLDADNWLDPDHVALCLETARRAEGGRVDYVIARRRFLRRDNTVFPGVDEPVENHVDTNCFFFLPPAYHVVSHFGMVPKRVAAAGDRIFYGMLRHRRLRAAINDRITVNYLADFQPCYEAVGEVAPADAKPMIDLTPMQAWLDGLQGEERLLVHRLTGYVP